MDDSDHSKLFVGGICWDTTEDTLREHFGQYGTVIGCVVAKDRNSGSPRGFAFVSFSDSDALNKALEDTHEILGRTVEVKKAIPRSEQHQNQQQSRWLTRNSRSSGRSSDQFRTKKIFVGGLSANLTEEEFKSYFEKFGRITDVVVMHDNVTHRPRGFGFITFDSEDAVEDVMQKNYYELSGKLVEVKRAVPKEGNNNNSSGYNARAGTGRGSNSNSYQQVNYAPYSPRYEMLPGYGPVFGYGGVTGYYGAGVLGAGYPTGAYGGIGYGIAPVAPRSPWNGPAMVGVRGSLLPCGSAATVYPAYLNGGVGMIANGYSGILGAGGNEKPSQIGGGEAQVTADMMPTQIDRGCVDVVSSGSGGSYGAASSKQNQRDIDGRFRAYPAGSSS
ncbi:unnamed protein product [Ilex paraguariensis]|uniref:RRM domain-containing protein n=1 Tax=Ilex paraguariensis TaxID=185542 RepID=A0ABC8UGD1_9AQUA